MFSQSYFLSVSESGERAADLGLDIDIDQNGLWLTKHSSFSERSK